MRFKRRLPNDTATLLLLAVFIIVLVGLSLGSHDTASTHVKTISAIAAVALLAVYLSWVVPYVRGTAGHRLGGARRHGGGAPGAGAERRGRPARRRRRRIGLRVGLVRDRADAGDGGIGVSKAFAGLVIVAIAGNAVENVTGIVLAAKGQADLAVSVVKNSVAQIAAFLFPVLVLISLLLATS